MKGHQFNVVYNPSEDMFGKGYYVIYENYKHVPTFDCYYQLCDDHYIFANIIEKIKSMIDLGFEFNPYYQSSIEDLKKIF